MTNADRIRQMTDEELANIVKYWLECDNCPCNYGDCGADCFYAACKWLKQEATDAEQQDPAHWILDDNGEAYCSECHCEGEPYMCYCPMCGKKMGGGA